MDLILRKECRMCMTTGVGKVTNDLGEIVDANPCPACNGTGYTNYGKICDDGMVLAIDLLAAINITEYANLTDAQKEGVKVILSCGIIDISEGSYTTTKFTGWFGAESTTMSNISAL